MSDRLAALKAALCTIVDGVDLRQINEGSMELTLQRVGERLMHAAGLDPSDLMVDVRILEPLTDEAGDAA